MIEYMLHVTFVGEVINGPLLIALSMYWSLAGTCAFSILNIISVLWFRLILKSPSRLFHYLSDLRAIVYKNQTVSGSCVKDVYGFFIF